MKQILLYSIIVLMTSFNCSSPRRTIEETSYSNKRQDPFTYILQDSYFDYPHHLSFHIKNYSDRDVDICAFGNVNKPQMTVLSLDNEIIYSQPQLPCNSYPSWLLPGEFYIIPVLPQVYMSERHVPSGKYKLCGSYRDYRDYTVYSDTVLFHYDSTFDYKFLKKKDWSQVIKFSTGRWLQDSIIVLHIYNLSITDTIDLKTQTRITLNLHKTDKSFDVTHKLVNGLLLPGAVDSVLIYPSLFRQHLGSKKGVYVALWEFLESKSIAPGINSYHVN